MKKILSIIVLTSLFFVSCSSDGDQGPQGPPGEDGVNIVGQAFEATVDFTDPDYSVFVEIPENIEVLDTDIVLVYWLEAVEDDADVWALLPQVYYLDNGEQFQYNYNHTNFDVNIYIDSPVEVSSLGLGSGFTQDQVFKVVVLPVDYSANANIDVSSYQNLKTSINIKESNINVKTYK